MCQVSRVRCHVSRVTSKSQTVRARELNFWENGYLLSPVICHMSGVTCDMSRVPCHMSLIFLLSFLLDKVVKLVGGGSVIIGADPVYFLWNHVFSQWKSRSKCTWKLLRWVFKGQDNHVFNILSFPVKTWEGSQFGQTTPLPGACRKIPSQMS